MNNMKYDMSDKCGFLYEEPRTPEWERWYMENCDKCVYMCEICMYGEEVEDNIADVGFAYEEPIEDDAFEVKHNAKWEDDRYRIPERRTR